MLYIPKYLALLVILWELPVLLNVVNNFCVGLKLTIENPRCCVDFLYLSVDVTSYTARLTCPEYRYSFYLQFAGKYFPIPINCY